VMTLTIAEQQQVEIPRALHRNSRILVMDEPTVGLDPLTRSALWEEFHHIARAGAALIISSHVMEEAACCDNLILMRAGQIIWQGTPIQLLESTKATSYEDAFRIAIAATATQDLP